MIDALTKVFDCACNQFCSIIKLYAAAVSSCHEVFGDRRVFSHPVVKLFLQGTRRQCLVMDAASPQWELPLVIKAQGSLQASGALLSEGVVTQDSFAVCSDLS